ncbi:MAG: hypothetical protein ACI9RO_000395 [Alteromonas macleodii]|jgi:hypothetical protein
MAAQPRQVDIAVIGLGVNEIVHGTTRATWLAQTQALNNYLINEISIGHVYAFVLPPVWQFPRLPNPLRWTLRHSAGRLIRAFAKCWPISQSQR